MSWMLLAVLTSDLVASFVRGLTVQLAIARAELSDAHWHAPYTQ